MAAWENLQSCGRVWLCPVCSAKIRARRASEIAQAGVRQLASGGGLLTMAHTFPHDASMLLSDAWGILAKSYKLMCSGKASVQDREAFGILGHVKAYEVTLGANGWHPHGHTLWFTETPPSSMRVETLNRRLFNRFSRSVERETGRVPLSTYNRMKPVRDVSALAVYVAKAANELVRFDVKDGRAGGRTPFQILGDFADTGDCADLDRWHEWEEHSRGRASIRWTPGLKGRFKVEEVTDEEAAADEVAGEESDRFTFTDEQWERVVRIPNAQALLMHSIEAGGIEAVASALDALAIEADAAGMLGEG